MRSEMLEGLLAVVGVPVVYRRFGAATAREGVKPPYIMYTVSNESAGGADERILFKKSKIYMEFYSVKKDRLREETIERVLDFVHWAKDEDYIESEGLYVISYEFELFEKIRRKVL